MEGNVDTGTVTTGPTTFSDASLSWSDASSASDPSSATPAADSANADAIAPPAQSATPEGQPQQGEPPKERWPDILDNARKKATEEWDQQYGWAKQVNREAVEKFASIAQRYQGDPVGLLQELAAEVQAHPEHGAKLRTFAAQQLAAARRQQSAPEAPNLDAIEIDLGNGQSVPLSALKQQWMAEVEQKFSPVVKSVEQANQERAQQASEHFASTTVGELTKQLPDFGTHAREIGQRLQAMKLSTDDPAVLKLAVKAIYADVVTPQREQQLASKAQSQLLDNLQHKAAASTSVNPGSAAASSPRAVTRFDQLPPEAWK
jgi:hypothetical protein